MQLTTCLPSNHPGKYEFHISRSVRDKYAFDAGIYSLNGNVLFADFTSARRFAAKLNALRQDSDAPIRAGQINAMGLIDEILHLVIGLYKLQIQPSVIQEALDWLYTRIGQEEVDQALRLFAEQFPALNVYIGLVEPEAYFEGKTNGVPNTQVILEEMLMLWLANVNPAFSPFNELFDDNDLADETVYPEIIKQLDQFFNYQPTFGPKKQQLIEMLRSPAKASPNSLGGQLEYIRRNWTELLGDILIRLLSSLDMIAEEEKAIFGGPGPAEIIDFDA